MQGGEEEEEEEEAGGRRGKNWCSVMVAAMVGGGEGFMADQTGTGTGTETGTEKKKEERRKKKKEEGGKKEMGTIIIKDQNQGGPKLWNATSCRVPRRPVPRQLATSCSAPRHPWAFRE